MCNLSFVCRLLLFVFAEDHNNGLTGSCGSWRGVVGTTRRGKRSFFTRGGEGQVGGEENHRQVEISLQIQKFDHQTGVGYQLHIFNWYPTPGKMNSRRSYSLTELNSCLTEKTALAITKANDTVHASWKYIKMHDFNQELDNTNSPVCGWQAQPRSCRIPTR